MRGKIIKGIAGFYYVHVSNAGIYECKAKGVFRKDNVKPLVGDNVELQVLDEQEKTGNIIRIFDRSSQLIRPAVANVDQALVIFAITSPQPNFNLLDRFLIMMRQQKLPSIICFNKLDLDREEQGERYRRIYADCGYPTLTVSAELSLGIEELKAMLAGRTTTVAGPSGVGKSSLINRLQPDVIMETGTISKKIERGRHTTRHAELIPVRFPENETAARRESSARDTYILDTPGFSSLGLFELEKEELAGFYPEFAQYEKYCRFGGCSHISEPDCGVKQALMEGKLSKLRYDNYCQMYEELKQRRKY